MNCNGPTKGKFNFQGVILCSHCFSLAKMCMTRAEKQCEHILSIYKEGLRVSLASGRLRPTSEIPGSEKSRPPSLEQIKEVLGGAAKILDKKPEKVIRRKDGG